MDTRNPQPKEMIGSKDLRESFKETDRIRGSWFLNGVEMHQFEANSPASAVAQINAKSSGTFITAEIDDQGHLVLIDKSGADIQIGLGAPYVEAAPGSSGDVAKDVLKNLRHEQEKDHNERRGNRVLEMLGLEATDQASAGAEDSALAQSGVAAGFETGLSADERNERWRRETGQSNPSQQANPSRQGSAGVDKRGAPQIPSNPTPGNESGAQGRLDDGRGRSGTGGGQGETAGATIQREHGGAGQRQAPVPGA